MTVLWILGSIPSIKSYPRTNPSLEICRIILEKGSLHSIMISFQYADVLT